MTKLFLLLLTPSLLFTFIHSFPTTFHSSSSPENDAPISFSRLTDIKELPQQIKEIEMVNLNRHSGSLFNNHTKGNDKKDEKDEKEQKPDKNGNNRQPGKKNDSDGDGDEEKEVVKTGVEYIFGRVGVDEVGERAWNRLAEMTDTYGPRPAGSDALENSIDFLVDKIQEDGMKVWTEEVEVPYWKRGQESATLITPTLKTKLSILGLGFSTPTPPEGITAEIIVFSSYDELNKAGEQGLVKGKIVVYNEEWKGYDDTVSYRSRGAVEAAKRGAVATLVRSVTPYGIRTPHTGFSVRSIPSAAIAIEDATLLNRLYNRHVSNPGKYPAPKVKLVLKSKLFPKRTSRNVIVELKGQDEVLSKEIVLVGGHIDSWDVGAGAQDDGAGMMVTYEALRIIASLPSHLKPKRTIRTVFFTAEEIGGPGAKAYFNKYSKDPNTKHIFLLESDSGIFNPYGLSLDSKSPSQLQYLQEISKRFVAPNVQNSEGSNIEVGYSGADVEAWCPIAMCVGWVSSGEQYLLEKNRKGTANSREEYYFWYHHTNGDTMDVVSPHDLGSNSVVIAAYAYAVASLGVPTVESQ